MNKLFGFFILCTLSNVSFGQNLDSTYFKGGYAGGHLIVPENESWVIDRAFVNDGTAYSIKISNTNFNTIYLAGDTIKFPYYIAEMELLEKTDMVQFQLYIKKEEK